MTYQVRGDILSSQHIQLALVLQETLGMREAGEYLRKQNIPDRIIDRVLLTSQRRWDADARRENVESTPFPACRRRDRVREAVVEAALKVETRLGRPWASTLLSDEQVPEAVIIRVLARGPRRCTKPPAEQRDHA